MDIALTQSAASAVPDPSGVKPPKRNFTLKQALIAGFLLGSLYTVVAGVVAHQMAAYGACLASQYR